MISVSPLKVMHLRRSILTLSGWVRAGLVSALITLLWLAIWWAVMLP